MRTMLYIIRHGQTSKNKAGALQGRSDSPLNQQGEEQARQAAAWLQEQGIRFDLVYTSPLQRAQATARILAGQAPIVVDQRLIEMDYGPYEGMDLNNLAPEVLEFFSDFAHNPAPEGMEQLSAVVARLGELLEDIRSEVMDKTVLLSTHAIAMKGALEYLTPQSQGAYWSTYVANCSIYAAQTGDAGYGVPVEVWRP